MDSRRQLNYLELRKKLSQYKYNQNFSIESLELVDCLFTDLLNTTSSYKEIKEKENRLSVDLNLLQSQIFPLRKENNRLNKENGQLHLDLIKDKDNYDQLVNQQYITNKSYNDSINELKLMNSMITKELDSKEKEFNKLKKAYESLSSSMLKNERTAVSQIKISTPITNESNQISHTFIESNKSESDIINNLRDKLDESNSTISNLLKQIDQLKNNLNLREDELIRLTTNPNSNATLTANQSDKTDNLLSIDISNKRIIDQLNSQIDFLNEQLAARETQINRYIDKQIDYDNMIVSYDQLKQDFIRVQSINKELESQIQKSDKQIHELKSKIVQDSTHVVMPDKSKYNNYSEAVTEAKESLELSDRSDDSLVFSNSNKQTDSKKYTKLLDKKLSDKVTKTTTRPAIKSVVKSVDKKIDKNVDKQSEISKNQLNELLDENNTLHNNINHSHKIIDQLKLEVDSLTNQLYKLTQSNTSNYSIAQIEKDHKLSYDYIYNKLNSYINKYANIINYFNSSDSKDDDLLNDKNQSIELLLDQLPDLTIYLTTYQNLEINKNQLDKNIKLLQDELAYYKVNQNQSRSDYYQQSNNLNNLNSELSNEMKSKKNLTIQLEKYIDISNELSSKVFSCESEIKEKDYIIQQHILDNQKLAEKIQNLLDEINSVQEESDNAVIYKREYENAINQINLLKSLLNDSKIQLQTQIELSKTLEANNALYQCTINENNQKINILSTKLNEIDKLNNQLNVEKNNLLNDIIDKNNQLNDLNRKSSYNNNNDKIQQLVDKNKSLLNQIENLNNMNSNLTNDKSILENELIELKDLINSMKYSITNLYNDIKSLNIINNQLIDEKENLEKLLNQLNMNYNTINGERNDLISQLKDKNSSIDNKNNEIFILNKQLNELKVNGNEIIEKNKKLIDKNEEIIRNYDNIQNSNNYLNNCLIQLNNNLNDQMKIIKNYEIQIDIKDKDIINSKNDLNLLINENQTLTNELSNNLNEKIQLTNNINELNNIINNLKYELKIIEIEKNDLLDRYKNCLLEKRKIENDSHELSSQKNQASQNLQQLSNELSDFKISVSNYQRNEQKLQADRLALTKQIDLLTEELAKRSRTIEAIEADNRRFLNDTHSLRQTNVMLNDRQQHLLNRVNELIDSSKVLSTRVTSLERERDALSKLLTTERQRSADMTKLVESVRAQMAKMRFESITQVNFAATINSYSSSSNESTTQQRSQYNSNNYTYSNQLNVPVDNKVDSEISRIDKQVFSDSSESLSNNDNINIRVTQLDSSSVISSDSMIDKTVNNTSVRLDVNPSRPLESYIVNENISSESDMISSLGLSVNDDDD